MFVILSKADGDLSTEHVLDWLKFKGHDYVRINGSNFLTQPFSVRLKNSGTFFKSRNKPAEKLLNLLVESMPTIWFRRWFCSTISNKSYRTPFTYGVKEHEQIPLAIVIQNYLKNERAIFSQWIFSSLKATGSNLNVHGFKTLNKLEVLAQASLAKLQVPETLVTNSKKELIDFIADHRRVICKPL